MSKKCFHCIRIFLVVVNFTLFLIGIAILGTSLFLYVTKINQDIIRSQHQYIEFQKIFILIMITGTLTICLSSIGCYGAYQESQITLSIYFSLMLLLFATNVAFGSLYYVYKDEKLSADLKIYIENHKLKKSSKQDDIFLDSVQRMFECCGVDNVNDYDIKDSSSTIPLSCCDYNQFECKDKVDKKMSFTEGCKEKYKKYPAKHFRYLSMIVIGMSSVEFFGMVLAISLCFSIRYTDNNGYIAVNKRMVV